MPQTYVIYCIDSLSWGKKDDLNVRAIETRKSYLMIYPKIMNRYLCMIYIIENTKVFKLLKYLLKYFVSLLFLLTSFSPALAETSQKGVRDLAATQKIYKISIKGHRKIEKAAIEAKLVSKVGEVYRYSKVSQDVRAIFAMGFFYDVTVDHESHSKGVFLTYTVVEKPPVLKISYSGNSEFDDDELAESAGIKIFEILDLSKVRSAVDKIRKLYEDKGYYLVRVRYEYEKVKMVKRKGVSLKFLIEENERVTVKRVSFLGNKQISSLKLKSMMKTQEGGFFSFLSNSGAYKKEDFDQDVQRLNFLYFNEGFVQVKIDTPLITVTPDKSGIYISFRIEEGERFNIGEVNFTGDLLFTDQELADSVKTESGLRFAYDRLQRDLLALQVKYGDRGYAFTNTIPRTRIREKERLVDVTFEIDKGQKAYIGQINVKGNTKTRDKVIRRELLLSEGELYNETRKRESLANVRRLGFFEEVRFIPSTPRDNLNIVNIDIHVKERRTGSINLGVGYSDEQKLIVNGQVNQNHLFGRGQRLSASLNWSQIEQIFRVNFTEPYFMDTKWLFGFDIYRVQQRRRTLYKDDRTGAGIRMGHPLSPYLQGILGYKLDDTELTLEPEGDPDLLPVETANGLTSALTFSLIYDKRNDRFMPTAGLYSNLSLEYAGLGGDRKYTKGLATAKFYKNIFWDVVLRNNVNYGFIFPNISGEEPPFDELFLLGGATTLRGYNWWSVGRRRRSKKVLDELLNQLPREEAERKSLLPFGGRQQFYYQVELQKPLIREAGILGVIFYDVGAAEDSISLSDFRSDVGFGFRWFSPIGPLRFEFGFPLNPRKDLGEPSSVFHFSIGTPF